MSWEVDQAVTQAKDDGKRMEARLQELGEEANNLEDALSETEADRDRLAAELQAVRDELATAYKEIILSRQSEGDTMADLLATREERDSLRAELDRLRSAPVAVEVPDLDNYETRPCEPRVSNEDPEDWYAIAQWESERADAWKAFAELNLQDPSRILKEGEREELDILRQVAKLIDDKRNAQWEKRGAGPCQRMPDEIDNLLCDWYEIQAQRESNALRSQRAAEGSAG